MSENKVAAEVDPKTLEEHIEGVIKRYISGHERLSGAASPSLFLVGRNGIFPSQRMVLSGLNMSKKASISRGLDIPFVHIPGVPNTLYPCFKDLKGTKKMLTHHGITEIKYKAEITTTSNGMKVMGFPTGTVDKLKGLFGKKVDEKPESISNTFLTVTISDATFATIVKVKVRSVTPAYPVKDGEESTLVLARYILDPANVEVSIHATGMSKEGVQALTEFDGLPWFSKDHYKVLLGESILEPTEAQPEEVVPPEAQVDPLAQQTVAPGTDPSSVGTEDNGQAAEKPKVEFDEDHTEALVAGLKEKITALESKLSTSERNLQESAEKLSALEKALDSDEPNPVVSVYEERNQELTGRLTGAESSIARLEESTSLTKDKGNAIIESLAAHLESISGRVLKGPPKIDLSATKLASMELEAAKNRASGNKKKNSTSSINHSGDTGQGPVNAVGKGGHEGSTNLGNINELAEKILSVLDAHLTAIGVDNIESYVVPTAEETKEEPDDKKIDGGAAGGIVDNSKVEAEDYPPINPATNKPYTFQGYLDMEDGGPLSEGMKRHLEELMPSESFAHVISSPSYNGTVVDYIQEKNIDGIEMLGSNEAVTEALTDTTPQGVPAGSSTGGPSVAHRTVKEVGNNLTRRELDPTTINPSTKEEYTIEEYEELGSANLSEGQRVHYHVLKHMRELDSALDDEED